MRKGPHLRIISLSLILSLCLSAFGAIPAFAGECDGTPGDDDGVSNPIIVCPASPIVPDGEVGLGLGDDTYVQDDLVLALSVQGDALEDGTDNTGNGGNDTITISGGSFGVTGDGTDGNGGADTITITVNGAALIVAGDQVTGNGGDDLIVVDGLSVTVSGDFADGDGGNDRIIVNGEADDVMGDDLIAGNGGDDLIVINGTVNFDVTGDCATVGDGGDDTIIVNGIVGGNVEGDCVGGNGGNDVITINGTVGGDVLGDVATGAGGNDTVIVTANADVFGLIDGEDGTDSLQFTFLYQDDLTDLDPAGGTLSYNGHTYTWANFEQLIGLLQELGLRIIYQHNGLAAVSVEDGIKVMNESGLVAFIPFSSAAGISVGSSVMFQSAAHSLGWYVKVFNLGTNPANPANNLFQVNIYNAAGALQGQFTFSE